MPAKRKPSGSPAPTAVNIGGNASSSSASQPSKRSKLAPLAELESECNGYYLACRAVTNVLSKELGVGDGSINSIIVSYLVKGDSWAAMAQDFVLDPVQYPDVMDQYHSAAQSLLKDGFVSIPIFNADERKSIERSLDEAVAQFPEYLDPGKTDHLVWGNLGALNNASSFHNLPVRALRLDVHWPVVALLRQVEAILVQARGEERPFDIKSATSASTESIRRIEQLPDRLVWRHPTKIPTDTSPQRYRAGCSDPEDSVFAAWLNCNDFEQTFSCLPGSQRSAVRSPDGLGYQHLTAAEKRYDDDPLLKSSVVKPGYLLIYFRQIVQAESAIQYPDRVKQLHLGWRLTNTDKPLFEDQRESMISKSIPSILRSRAGMDMWSRGDGEGISWDIREWSCKTFIPKMLIGKGASRVVRRRAISLKQQGLDIFPPYADSELAILSPQALFAQPPINHFHLSQFVNCSQ